MIKTSDQVFIVKGVTGEGKTFEVVVLATDIAEAFELSKKQFCPDSPNDIIKGGIISITLLAEFAWKKN